MKSSKRPVPAVDRSDVLIRRDALILVSALADQPQRDSVRLRLLQPTLSRRCSLDFAPNRTCARMARHLIEYEYRLAPEHELEKQALASFLSYTVSIALRLIPRSSGTP